MKWRKWSVHLHLRLSPRAKMAHRASTCAFHRFMSCAAVRTSLQDWHPPLDLSFSTVLRSKVVFGRLLFLFPSGVQVSAVTQSLSGCCLRMCPMNRNLLLLTSSLNLSTLALSSSSLLLILSCHFNSFPTYVAQWSSRGPPWESVTKNLRYSRFPPNLDSMMISSLANYRPFFSSFPHTPPSGEFCQVS